MYQDGRCPWHALINSSRVDKVWHYVDNACLLRHHTWYYNLCVVIGATWHIVPSAVVPFPQPPPPHRTASSHRHPPRPTPPHRTSRRLSQITYSTAGRSRRVSAQAQCPLPFHQNCALVTGSILPLAPSFAPSLLAPPRGEGRGVWVILAWLVSPLSLSWQA